MWDSADIGVGTEFKCKPSTWEGILQRMVGSDTAASPQADRKPPWVTEEQFHGGTPGDKAEHPSIEAMMVIMT